MEFLGAFKTATVGVRTLNRDLQKPPTNHRIAIAVVEALSVLRVGVEITLKPSHRRQHERPVMLALGIRKSTVFRAK